MYGKLLIAALALGWAGVVQSKTIVIPMVGSGTDADTVTFQTLCTGEDWVIFNAASQKTGKLVSVCMTEGDDTTPNHLTYRYGRPGKVELAFPVRAKGSEQAFTLRRYTRPQVTYLKFEFTTKGYNYEILEGSEGADVETFLRVVRTSDGATILEHALTPNMSRSSLMELENLVRSAPFDE